MVIIFCEKVLTPYAYVSIIYYANQTWAAKMLRIAVIRLFMTKQTSMDPLHAGMAELADAYV